MRALGMVVAVAWLAGCPAKPPSNGYAVDLTIHGDATVTPAIVAQIHELDLVVSNAETYSATFNRAGLLGNGDERLIYRPGVQSGTDDFEVTARDSVGSVLAYGKTSASLMAMSTVLATVTLTAGGPPAEDMRGEDLAGADLAGDQGRSPDLAHVDLKGVDLSGDMAHPADLLRDLLGSPCGNGLHDGNETDVDCGGGTCGQCTLGLHCLVGSDCTTGNCLATQSGVLVCAAFASCPTCQVIDPTGTVCVNATANTNPKNECNASVAGCQQSDCDGQGTCNVAKGTACGAAGCGNNQTINPFCDDKGVCQMNALSCNGFQCSGSSCATGCASDAECIPNYLCDTTTSPGLCVPLPFLPPQALGILAGPSAIAVADGNCDGKLDLLIAAGGAHVVREFAGDGDGTFSFVGDVTVGQSPIAIVVGDFNLDGKLDLATADAGANTVTVLYGNGQGGILQSSTLFGVVGPTSIASGDIDGDGFLDLVVGTNVGYTTFHNDGMGNFVFLFSNMITPRGSVTQIALVDLNLDSQPDLVLASGSAVDIETNSNGAFASQSSISGSSGNLSFAVGDVNNDGNLDVVIGASDGLYTYIGSASLGFAAGGVLPVGAVVSPVLQDFNNDGKLDVAYGLVASNTVSLHLGRGDGTFGRSVPTAAYGVYPVAGDFNRDGRVDLAVGGSSNSVAILINAFPPFLNTSFNPADRYPVGAGPAALLLGDGFFNARDGYLDLAIADQTGNTITFYNNQGPTNPGAFVMGPAVGITFSGPVGLDVANLTHTVGGQAIILQAGNNTVAVAGMTPLTVGLPFTPAALTHADLSHRGRPDLVVVGSSTTFQVVTFDASGSSFTQTPWPLSTMTGAAVAVEDLNCDGWTDVVVAGDSGISVSLGGPSGFPSTSGFSSSARERGVVIGDFNRDGKPDIATAEPDADSVTIRINTGGGAFAMAQLYKTGTGTKPNSIVGGDFNRDGKIDLAVPLSAGDGMSVFLGQGDGTFAAAINVPAGSALTTLAVGDADDNGTPDVFAVDAASNNFYFIRNTSR